jgi:hypothetical protein
MPVSPQLQQYDVISLEDWELDEDFPFGPQGAKAKRIFVCPNPPPFPFLIGGHRYLFKEPAGIHAQQIWSEVIAYELSRDLCLPVPPAFLARAPGNGSPGVLIEFFYGYAFEPETRFVHAIERLQGAGYPIDYQRGSLKDNINLCRLHAVPTWRAWWARTLAFDALIGNGDRHTENWGMLIQSGRARLSYSMAPAFDNGSSLGYIIREADLEKWTQPRRLKILLDRGMHHFGWVAGDALSAQHARLCRVYCDRIAGVRNAMDDALALTDTRIARLVEWCCGFDFALPFSEARAHFVSAQLRARRDALAMALGA